MNNERKPIIKVEDMHLSFGENVIFERVNLTIFENESVVIIGPSGSGKTVFLKLLAGVYPPTSGKISIRDQDWQSLQNEEKHDQAQKVGMTFQQGALFDTMTALENVQFPIKEHLHLSDEEILEMSKDMLSKVNLGDALDKIPSELSGGMQKRLAIARALILKPELIFYDDPLAGQDPIQKDQMSDLMLEFKHKYKSTLIMSTSYMKTAFKMADRVLMAIDKEIIDTGSPEQTRNHSDPRVQQFIHGRVDGPITTKKL